MFWTMAFVSLPAVYFTHKLIERLTPTGTTLYDYSAYYGWYLLEFFSKVEIKVQNVYAKISPYLPSVKKDDQTFITFIKDGEEVEKYNLNDFMKKRETNIFSRDNYDFIFYELPISNNDKYDKCMLRYDNHDNIMKIEFNAIIHDFNFNVIQFNFKDTEKIYNINFNRIQFIINYNILFDRAFLKWYLNKYNNAVVQDEDQYTITFIDHEMNYVSLTQDSYIVIKNKSYEVVSETVSENVNDTVSETVNETVNETVSDTVNETVSETVSVVNETVIDEINENLRVIDTMIDKINDNVSVIDALSDAVNEISISEAINPLSVSGYILVNEDII